MSRFSLKSQSPDDSMTQFFDQLLRLLQILGAQPLPGRQLFHVARPYYGCVSEHDATSGNV